MAFSTRGLTAKEPIIPLILLYEEASLSTVTLASSFVDNNGNTVKCKYEVPKIATADIEAMLRITRDFDVAVEEENLNCEDNGPKLFTLFRQILTGSVRDTWDIAKAGQANTQAGLQAAIDDFLGHYIMPSDYADEKHYLDTVRKPISLDCLALATCLRYINTLVAVFLVANDIAPYNDYNLKLCYYNMMLEDWKRVFFQSGHELTDANYTLDNLACYMAGIELTHNLNHTSRRPAAQDYHPRRSSQSNR